LKVSAFSGRSETAQTGTSTRGKFALSRAGALNPPSDPFASSDKGFGFRRLDSNARYGRGPDHFLEVDNPRLPRNQSALERLGVMIRPLRPELEMIDLVEEPKKFVAQFGAEDIFEANLARQVLLRLGTPGCSELSGQRLSYRIGERQ
jgi:hypothetical protein